MPARGERRLARVHATGDERVTTLLDVRLSKMIAFRGRGRIEVLVDVLNVLNDTAEESLGTETLMTDTEMSATFGQPATFIDPRRAMFGVRLNLGR